MSGFNRSSSYFKKNNSHQINITAKISQKELKKNKKAEKNNNSNNVVSDKDFEELMEENEECKVKTQKVGQIKLSDYLNNIKDEEILNQLINDEKIFGFELADKAKELNLSGVQILKSLLNKYNNPEDYSWIDTNKYGEVLQIMLADNLQEQLICLLLIQNYSCALGLPKVSYKDKSVYYIKLIFQLLFTYDIIDESVYWKWQELLTNLSDIDEDTKNKICIQTTEFFNILKLTFTDADYEDEEENKNDKKEDEKELNQKFEPNLEAVTEQEQESESEDKYAVPEEQDWNMDDL